MKFVLSFCLISAVVSHCTDEYLVYGKRVVGDELLYRANVDRHGIPFVYQDVYVSYPKDGKASPDKQITAVCVQHNTRSTGNADIVLAYDADKNWSVVRQFGLILRGHNSLSIDTTVEFYGKNL